MYFFEKSFKIAPLLSQEEVFFKEIIIIIKHYHERNFLKFFYSLFSKHDNYRMRNRILYLISDLQITLRLNS